MLAMHHDRYYPDGFTSMVNYSRNGCYIRYVEVENKCKSIVHQAKVKYERCPGMACRNNPTLFRKFVQGKCQQGLVHY